MKIHGTAKGAALSTKDFGVAFGGAVAPALECTQTSTDEQWKFFSGAVGYGHRVGARLINAGDWACVGNVLGSVTFWMDKVGSPTGNVYCKVWRDGTADPFVEMGSKDVAALYPSGSATEITFDEPDSSYTLVDSDIVACEYTAGDSSNYPRLGVQNTEIAGVQRASYPNGGGTGWSIDTTRSCWIKTQ